MKKTMLMSEDFDFNPTCVLAKILFIQLKRITICLITCNTGFVRSVFHAQLGGIVRSSAGYLMVRLLKDLYVLAMQIGNGKHLKQ